jgi:hypothetical protein
VYVVHGRVVVEPAGFLIAKVAEAVPLRRRLGVEGPCVVIDNPVTLLVDILVEGLTAKKWLVFLVVERCVEGYSS